MELRVKLSGRILQFLCAILLNFHTMIYAMVVTWPSPALPLLLSEDSPLPTGKISIGDANLISSLPYFGGVVGTISFGFIGKRFGQKWPIILATIPEIVAALLIAFAQDVNYIHVARFLGGAAGGCLQLVVAYVCEVSEDR
ncbi:arabinose-proton symporter-like [Phlebotomus argentipes]|uniref:arabinose-proton symporter-like n=1 Tax=Phlebotomus argentipes TaxID=94469 RepID=UPI002892C6B0|nr:arabinose-proton symporter-like [Phlebotomus argentipes]